MDPAWHTEWPLRGRVALVTGGARGVGAAILRELARQGCMLALHHHASADAASQLEAELARQGARVARLRADLRQPTEIKELFSQIDARLGPVEILINNAAVFHPATVASTTLTLWDETLEVNLRAPFLCCQEAMRRMSSLGEGAIVNLLDLSGWQCWVGHAAHNAARAGLIALTRTLARELGPAIRVNGLAPGLIHPKNQQEEQLVRHIPHGRPGSPTEVATAVVFLLRSPGLNGMILPLDGGRLAGTAQLPSVWEPDAPVLP